MAFFHRKRLVFLLVFLLLCGLLWSRFSMAHADSLPPPPTPPRIYDTAQGRYTLLTRSDGSQCILYEAQTRKSPPFAEASQTHRSQK